MLALNLLRHRALLAAALVVSICAVLAQAHERTGMVLHLCFDVHEAAVANPGYAIAIHHFPPRKNGVSQETELEITSLAQGLTRGSNTRLAVQEWLRAVPSDSFETRGLQKTTVNLAMACQGLLGI